MDLTLNSDQIALRDGIRDYLAGRWDASRLRDASNGVTPISAADWKELAGLGVFGLIHPGELGLGLADAAVVFEELGAALVPGPLVPTLLAAGTVAGAAAGGTVVTALDSAARPAVVESPRFAGAVISLDGNGIFLRPMAEVPVTLVAAPLDPLTPVGVVTADLARGEQVGSAADATAWRLRGTVLTAALQVGVARGALDLGVRYVQEREQFGRVVGSFQAVKHLLAESLVRVELARAAVLAAAVTVDDPAVGDPQVAAATSKVLADDAATTGGRTCIQVHGGMGFTWEVLAHLYLKRAWVHETAFGSPADHEAFLATQLA